ncbi:Gamma-interferon-inducible lysosomal thiol reductase [Vitis vinifera]|uniref:Gamma-interferon-inducible lysosomal thiol reductase n=1 Tax=Vitis vinifera TaxID=29760 RepID=A0A438FA80_VITVI|nr:Gamma-interferon-inducible lysosomal thiol reductase [Vitis vinifera]RVX22764.1 Gamma-interferon-inducible lysosomal thiol reductase [Vitis vinifera]
MLTGEAVVTSESLPSESSMDSLSFSHLPCLLLIISSLFSAATARASISASEAEKVPLALYYETLCPYCSNFIVNHLIKLFNNGDGLVSIVDLKLLPYGNAKIGPNGTITCQDCAGLGPVLLPSRRKKPAISRIFKTQYTAGGAVTSQSFVFSSGALPSDSDKVSLGLYYESLCPYSANFIINYLVKIFENGLISIVELNLVPFGNAKIRGNNTIDCQHGPAECLLNTVEACAIDVWPDLSQHFSFIYCIETLVYEHKYPQWETCFEKLGLDPKPISDCYNSGYGKELELKYAAETNGLQPPHKYVPWVVVDGQPLYEEYENFISYICKAYKGPSIPSACNELSLNTIVKENVNPAGPVCYTEETIKPTLSSIIGSTIKAWMQRMNRAALI